MSSWFVVLEYGNGSMKPEQAMNPAVDERCASSYTHAVTASLRRSPFDLGKALPPGRPRLSNAQSTSRVEYEQRLLRAMEEVNGQTGQSSDFEVCSCIHYLIKERATVMTVFSFVPSHQFPLYVPWVSCGHPSLIPGPFSISALHNLTAKRASPKRPARAKQEGYQSS